MIGRTWEEDECLTGLLSQWNYWCWYMNHGPADLPKPLLFFKEKENVLESFCSAYTASGCVPAQRRALRCRSSC
jgi:hypothetical protein